MSLSVTEGYIAFSHVLTEDQYQGQDVGYNITLCMDKEEAAKLSALDVIIKDYQGVAQRKFKSGYSIDILDDNGQAMSMTEELPRGTKVRVQWKHGNIHPQHGLATYANRVKVLEMGTGDIPLDFENAEETTDF
jgi:hypothetical protein|tara:strand:- start:167 stop:568 length:402 start_codon:yes stop_codon:yes gene_type:complete